MKTQAIVMVMLLASILVVGIADGNTISEVNWGNATPANLNELVKQLDISQQNNLIVGEKIKGYIREPTGGVYNFTHGTIKQLVVNESGIVASYYDLSAEDQFIWDQNITTYRFTVNDADSDIITKKLVVYVFYKDCKVVGYAWGYAEEVKTTPTYISSTSCIAGQITDVPSDSSGGGGGGSNPSSGPSDAPSGPSGPSDGPTGPSDPGPTG